MADPGKTDLALAPTQHAHPSVPGPIDLTASTLEEASFTERYEAKAVLGRGGMGEVRLFRDRRIGREVALKVLLPAVSGHDGRARFLREARVQGQLEHPSVVPVYDLGLSPDGSAFFTMKRIRGVALDQVLRQLAEKDAGTQARFGLRKLLTAFANVCLSVDFAHSRGVLHRDLKPSNVMLGDFGEVHVLDWGVAKLVGVPDETEASPLELSRETGTVQGSLMGTPGYMSPEQARGEIDRLDARSDVYALGAILYEILALRPLHQGTTIAQLVSSTLAGADGRPSLHAPETPPELDGICTRALALDPAARWPSARALADAVERFLDGDRDLAMRKARAEEHAKAAKEALTHLGDRGEVGREARATAMREATRALAYAPDHVGAAGVIARLLIEVPSEMPQEAQQEMEEKRGPTRRTVAKFSTLRAIGLCGFLPLVMWMGVRSWPTVVALGSTLLMVSALNLYLWKKRDGRVDGLLGALPFLLSTTGIGIMTALVGPFFFIPTVVLLNSMVSAAQADFRLRPWFVLVTIAPIVVPFVLQLVGVLSPWYSFQGDTMTIFAHMVKLRAAPTTFFFVGTACLMGALPLTLIHRIRSALDESERRLFLNAWHLRQLLPKEAASRR